MKENWITNEPPIWYENYNNTYSYLKQSSIDHLSKESKEIYSANSKISKSPYKGTLARITNVEGKDSFYISLYPQNTTTIQTFYAPT